MNRVVILAASIIMVCNASAVEQLQLADLVGGVFKNISVEGTNLVFQFKSAGGRFSYSVNDSEKKISEYGGALHISIGMTFRLYSRAMVLSFSALPSQIREHGFYVHMIEDHRSIGKIRREKEGYLLFQKKMKNGQIVCDEEGDKDCDIGVMIVEASIDAAIAALTNKASAGSSNYVPILK